MVWIAYQARSRSPGPSGPAPHVTAPDSFGTFTDVAIWLKRSDEALNHGTPASRVTRAIFLAAASDEASGLSIHNGLADATACFTCSKGCPPFQPSRLMPSTFRRNRA